MLSNLAMLRKKHKLSQKELAKKFNVNQNTVSRWENGDRQIDLETLKSLSVFFGVSVDFLLGKDGSASSVPDLPQDANELLALYGKMDDKFKIRLLGAAYAMLAEQKVNSDIDLDKMRKAAK